MYVNPELQIVGRFFFLNSPNTLGLVLQTPTTMALLCNSSCLQYNIPNIGMERQLTLSRQVTLTLHKDVHASYT